MKLITTLSITALILLTLSCKKEIIEEPVVEEQLIAENINPEMSQLQITMKAGVEYVGDVRGGYSGLLSNYNWELNYQIKDGYKTGIKVFYPIAKKWQVIGSVFEQEEYTTTEVLHTWEKKHDWSTTNKLYRFDPNTNKAYLYNGEEDTDPTVIMNFNLAVGDYWYFDLEHEMGLVVTDKFTITSNGETYPALKVKFVSQYETSKHRLFSYETTLSPLNPNPVLMGENFRSVLFPDWAIFKTNENPNQPENDWIPAHHDSYYSRSGRCLSVKWLIEGEEVSENPYHNRATYFIEY